ncbi:MAG: 3-isopropylmalate dehydratase small subunit [Mesorhizobium sp.]
MTPISTITGNVAAMPATNIDTDQIIPARFLKFRVTDGYQDFLFHDLRFDGDGKELPDFALNRVPSTEILLAGENFGCGSSREGAVQALQHYGVKVVIAESFGQIFENNCLKNGLLPIILSRADMEALLALYTGAVATLTVDLPNRVVKDSRGNRYSFAMDDFWHTLLMNGQDTLELTMTRMDEVLAFERQRIADEPWIVIPSLATNQEETAQ